MSDASTVRAGESLMLGNGAQLRLLDADEVGLPPEAYANSEARGRFTGERLFSTNPQLYSAIVKLVARDLSYREIEDILGVSVNTVCGVVWREGRSIETVRASLGRLGLDVARLSLETIRERLADPEERKKISAKDLAVIHGIATTNAQLMLGGATARIETPVTTPPTHEDYEAFMRSLRAINVTPATGSGAETARLKEAAPAAEPAPGEVVDLPGAQLPPEPAK